MLSGVVYARNIKKVIHTLILVRCLDALLLNWHRCYCCLWMVNAKCYLLISMLHPPFLYATAMCMLYAVCVSQGISSAVW